jgi:hypothetical protein
LRRRTTRCFPWPGTSRPSELRSHRARNAHDRTLRELVDGRRYLTPHWPTDQRGNHSSRAAAESGPSPPGPRWGRAPPENLGQQRRATVSRPRRSAGVSERSPRWSEHPDCLSHGGSQGFKSPHLHSALMTRGDADHRHVWAVAGPHNGWRTPHRVVLRHGSPVRYLSLERRRVSHLRPALCRAGDYVLAVFSRA